MSVLIGCKCPKRNRPNVREEETRCIYPNSAFLKCHTQGNRMVISSDF